jgi:micrococcal nuclease
VTKAFTPRSGGIVILNFDDDYKSAMTAVLKKSDFSKFPDVSQLVGKEVVVSGKFMDFKGSPEIELSDPKQVAVVK